MSAAKVDPSNANVFVHRGILALQARTDIAGARELIQKAIKIDPKCEFAYETLGTLEVPIHINLLCNLVEFKNYTSVSLIQHVNLQVQSGNLKVALSHFDQAIPLANTELEMAQICGLRAAASAQINVSDRLGIQLPSMMM